MDDAEPYDSTVKCAHTEKIIRFLNHGGEQADWLPLTLWERSSIDADQGIELSLKGRPYAIQLESPYPLVPHDYSHRPPIWLGPP